MTSKQTEGKNRELHEYFDKKVFELSTTGIFSKLMNEHLNYAIKCMEDTKDQHYIPSKIKAFAFSLFDILRIFYVFTLFIIISSSMFLCELLVPKYKSFLRNISAKFHHTILQFEALYIDIP